MRGIPAFSPVQASGTSFAAAVEKASTGLWSEGRSITLIIDGAEHEFPFDSAFAEVQALALLRDNGVPVIREDAPGIVVFRTAIVSMLVLVLVFLLA